MTRPSPSIAISLTAILIMTPALSAVPLAQGRTCAEIVTAFDDATQAFIRDADQQNIAFIHGEIFKDYGKTLTNAIDNERVTAAKEQFDELQGQREKLHDIYLCTANGSACLSSAIDKLTGKAREWIDGLTDKLGLNAVRDRVLAAMNLIQGYTDRVMKISTDTMTAMQQCTAPMPGQPRLTGESVPLVERVDADGLPAIETPEGKPINPSAGAARTGGGGSGAGKIIGSVAAIAGGAAAGLVLAQNVGGNIADDATSTSVGGSTSNNTPAVTGARRFDGTYDFSFVRTGSGGTETTVNVPRYLILNNGSLTTTEGTISGRIDADGNFQGSGVCPINELGADWTGRFTVSGAGSGSYRCRSGGISRSWTATRR